MTPGESRARLVDGWEHGFPRRQDRLLAVASAGYRALLGVRESLYAHGVLRSGAIDRPVVSVGNLTVGGTGKTPAVLLIVETLVALGHRPAVLSRGYGRRTRGVQVVADTASIRLEPEESGDEPFLLARRLRGVPVVVGANRHEAARVAVDRFGATVIVLDDGFQPRTLRKDLDVVMARAEHPWGNGKLLPRGPLREPLSALRRAGLVIVTGTDRVDACAEVARAARAHAPGIVVLPAAYVPTECWDAARMEPVKPDTLGGARVLAFAGIASPERFAQTLRELGVTVLDLVAFGDHHWYAARDLAMLVDRARALRADTLVTTEKDWVRLRALPPIGRPLHVLAVRLDLAGGDRDLRAALLRSCRTA